jgi:hypothetical protein
VSASRPTAIVAGALAAKAGNGGHAWSRISLVLGLRRLGFEVVFVEQLDEPKPAQRAYFESVCTQFEIDGYLVSGPVPYELLARAEAATLLLNVGGNLTLSDLKRAPAVKVYVDDDPAYTQFWHKAGLLEGRLAGHRFHFTFGESIGHPECSLPVNGINWRPLRPPVVLDQWPVGDRVHEGFTTVASWRGGYGRVEANGHLFSQKAHEFRRFVELPERTSQIFEIALKIDAADAADAELMQSHGWLLVDPTELTNSADKFRHYIQGSGSEFSVAQGIYVETSCGWFSDRTTRYLASGKPALVQDSGFSRHIPAGEGLVAFTTLNEAVAGACAIACDYKAHAEAARSIAEEYFDSDKVLGRMLEEVGL